MTLFAWNDNMMSVNVALFDAHHKKLVSLINDLHSAMLKRAGNAAMAGIMERLVDYSRYHFSEEERLMKEHDYPLYEEHRAEHMAFISKTVELQERLKNGDADISVETMKFLLNWLKKHILIMDKRYSGVFNNGDMR